MSVTTSSENSPHGISGPVVGMFLRGSDGGPPGYRSRKKPTVLAVDDDTQVLDFIVMALREEGYKVLCANSAKEATERHEDAECVDLLFTDIVMPGGCNGLDLAWQLLERCPNMKVLVSTGYADQPNASTSVGVGFPVLAKPYGLRDLVSAVRELLNDG